MDGQNPVNAGSQRMARLAAGSILYQTRISRVHKQALDVLGHVLCEIIESLFKNVRSFSSGTPSLIQYEGFEDKDIISLRAYPDYVHEAHMAVDMALTCLSVHPSSFIFLSGLVGNGWNPGYALSDLLDYTRLQVKFGEGQQDTLKKIMELTESKAVERWNRSTDRLPKSIFENSGFVNTAYSLIPPTTACIEEIEANAAPSKADSTDPIRAKRQLEAISEEAL